MAAKGDKWFPTKGQARVLRSGMKLGYDRTITDVCADANVNRATFYKWMTRDPGYKEAWRNLWKETTANYMPGAVAALGRKALTGDPAAIRLLAQLGQHLVEKSETVTKHDLTPTAEEALEKVLSPWEQDGAEDNVD